MAEISRSDLHLLKRLLWEARPYVPRLLVLLVLQLLATPLALLGPVPLKLAVDSIVHHHPLPRQAGWLPGSDGDLHQLLVSLCLLSLAIALASQVQNLLSSLMTTHTSQRVLLDFRSRLFRQAERLSLGYHTEKGTADTMYRIQTDATAIEWVFVDGVVPLVTSTFSLFTMLYVVLRLDWQIGCTALVIAPILFGLTRATRPILRRHTRELKKQEAKALGIIQEVLGILRVVKAFGQEDREQRRFTEAGEKCVRRKVLLQLADGTMGLLVNMTAAAGLTAVLYFGISNVLSGRLTLGNMLLISSYISQLYNPLKTLSRKTVNLQTQLTGAERAFALLDEPEEVPQKPHPIRIERARGEVEFRNVSFSYDGKRSALQGVSFTAPPGARIGIVGRTGAGKTTLTYLMSRFGDPDEGAVLLDAIDLREYDLADLRFQFAVVFQEPVLFATTLAENIAYARPDASMDDIMAAARAADVHDFIMTLPEQYESVVGERGMSLSGGERQRIGLARAFLRDAPILILDEPTSSVDVHTEAAIMSAMERLMQGRTTFIIAHRLNTLAACDLILRVEAGRLVQEKPDGFRIADEPAVAARIT